MPDRGPKRLGDVLRQVPGTARLALTKAVRPMSSKVAGRITTPRVPEEIWGLWYEGGDTGQGGWMLADDWQSGGGNYMMCFSEETARAVAEHQRVAHNIECAPVRIK